MSQEVPSAIKRLGGKCEVRTEARDQWARTGRGGSLGKEGKTINKEDICIMRVGPESKYKGRSRGKRNGASKTKKGGALM